MNRNLSVKDFCINYIFNKYLCTDPPCFYHKIFFFQIMLSRTTCILLFPIPRNSILKHRYKFLVSNRFYQIVERTHIKCLKHILFYRCHKNNSCLFIFAAKLPRRLHSVFPRHLDIQKKNIQLLRPPQQFLARPKKNHPGIRIGPADFACKQFPHILFIITYRNQHYLFPFYSDIIPDIIFIGT